MNDDRKVSIVFTGLITDPDLFARSLDQFTSIKQVNEIILATWDKEASEKKSILSEYAHRYGLIVVAVPEPVEWSGNLLSQMLSLYIGLRQSNKNNYVLKTRTDVFIEKEPLTNVFEKDLSLDLPTNYQFVKSPFEEKI